MGHQHMYKALITLEISLSGKSVVKSCRKRLIYWCDFLVCESQTSLFRFFIHDCGPVRRIVRVLLTLLVRAVRICLPPYACCPLLVAASRVIYCRSTFFIFRTTNKLLKKFTIGRVVSTSRHTMDFTALFASWIPCVDSHARS